MRTRVRLVAFLILLVSTALLMHAQITSNPIPASMHLPGPGTDWNGAALFMLFATLAVWMQVRAVRRGHQVIAHAARHAANDDALAKAIAGAGHRPDEITIARHQDQCGYSRPIQQTINNVEEHSHIRG